MYVQCSKVYQKKSGTLSLNRKLVESYRDPITKQPRNRTVKKLEQLPILERSRLILQYGGAKHLRAEEWHALNQAGDLNKEETTVKVGDLYSGAGSAVAYYHLRESGLLSVLSENLSVSVLKVIKELVLHQLLNTGSKSHFVKYRVCSYIYGLEGKPALSETTLYRCLDDMESQFTSIRDGMNKLAKREGPVLLYDLSNSYFCGTKAELGGRGQSKEKRHDRYIVTYGLVTDAHGQPLDIRIWKGGTAETKTVVSQFTDWQKHYQADKGIWIADRGMSGLENIADVTGLGLDHITGLPGNAQIALLKGQTEICPELFDQQNLAEFEHDNKRYILCKHDHKGYRREAQYARNRRKVYEKLCQIQSSPHNKSKEKLYHRTMKVLEKYEQTPFWGIEVSPIQGIAKNVPLKYKLTFRLNKEQVKVYNKIAHYYLLQTSLDKKAYTASQVQENYKSLHKVERCFRQLKDSLDIRPIRHWKEKRIKAHIYLSFISLWLLKHIERKWRDKGITSDIIPVLSHWNNALMLCQLLDKNGQQVNLKWNDGENARTTIQEIESYGEFSAIKPLL